MPVTALRLALVETDAKQRDVARRIGIHEVTLSRIVCGHRRASTGVMSTLAATVGRPVEELFDRDGQPIVIR